MSVHFLLAAAEDIAEDLAESVTHAVTNSAAALEGGIAAKTSLADWIVQGGIMMIPIFLCSIIALAIIIERVFYLRRVRLDTQRFLERLTYVLRAGMLMEAEVLCENTAGPMAKIAKTALLSRDKPSDEIRYAIEETAWRESRALERYVPTLGTIGSVSPLLGLLGTVLGMIKSSNFLAVSGAANTAGLIGGISEALITTAAGLFVAIPAVVCHSWFTNKINGIILEMESQTNDILAHLSCSKPATRGDTTRKARASAQSERSSKSESAKRERAAPKAKP